MFIFIYMSLGHMQQIYMHCVTNTHVYLYIYIYMYVIGHMLQIQMHCVTYTAHIHAMYTCKITREDTRAKASG